MVKDFFFNFNLSLMNYFGLLVVEQDAPTWSPCVGLTAVFNGYEPFLMFRLSFCTKTGDYIVNCSLRANDWSYTI